MRWKAVKQYAGAVLLAAVSSVLATVGGVGLFSWAVGVKLERDLLAAVAREGVSDQTFNIFYFGESTMVGEPYAPEASIPRIVEELLGKRVSGRTIRSVNLARAGVDFAWNLERLRQVVGNKTPCQPSLVVIYAGHNEFLKYDGPIVRGVSFLPRSYVDLAQRLDGLSTPLVIDERRFLDVPVVGPDERRAVNGRFGSALSEGLALLSANGIPAIVSTVAGNFADWEPNRSVYCAGNGGRDEFTRHVDRGRDLEARGDARGAIAAYEEAVAICDSVAEVHYRIGACYRRLGESAQAWDELQRAVDEDGMPIRATSAINDVIRRVGDGRLVSTVDAVRRLRERSADGLIGFDVTIDGHHPNLRGYLLIAELIAEEIQKRFPPTNGPLRDIGEAEAATRFGIDAGKRFEVAISRGRWFTKLATWRYDPRQRLNLADERFREARDIEPRRCESYLGQGMVAFLRGDAAAGERQVALARELNAPDVDRYLSESWVRQVRERARRIAEGRRGEQAGGTRGG